jgi:hypothetical protein
MLSSFVCCSCAGSLRTQEDSGGLRRTQEETVEDGSLATGVRNS